MQIVEVLIWVLLIVLYFILMYYNGKQKKKNERLKEEINYKTEIIKDYQNELERVAPTTKIRYIIDLENGERLSLEDVKKESRVGNKLIRIKYKDTWTIINENKIIKIDKIKYEED